MNIEEKVKKLMKIRKKIFSGIKKIFFHEIERYKNCLNCNKKLEGSRRKFCSNDCLNVYYRKKYSHPYKPSKDKQLVEMRRKYKNNVNNMKDKSIANRIAYKEVDIPKGTLCQICEQRKAVDRHHEDYDKPTDVMLLCRKCHMELHANIQAKINRFILKGGICEKCKKQLDGEE